jgi:hypothetical protein
MCGTNEEHDSHRAEQAGMACGDVPVRPEHDEQGQRTQTIRSRARTQPAVPAHRVLLISQVRSGLVTDLMRRRPGCPSTDTVATSGRRQRRPTCRQYEIRTPGGIVLRVLINHFTCQSGGGADKGRRQDGPTRALAETSPGPDERRSG